MDHNDARHKLSDYIDNAVMEHERIAIEEHLKTCAICADALVELRKTIDQLKQIEEVETPPWMTMKIMAQVRADTKKKTWAERLFQPLQIKLPIQAIAVVFLAIGAFYMYKNIQPASLPSEVGTQDFAAERTAPLGQAKKDQLAKTYDTAPRAQQAPQAPQAPEYKALDMKQEYEKPAPPKPTEAPVFAKKESAYAPPAPQAAAPSLLREQAGISAGSAARSAAKNKAAESYAADSVAANAITGGSAANNRQLPPNITAEMENIQRLLAYFADHDLPADMKRTGLKLSPEPVRDNLAGIAWLDDVTKKQLVACKNAYRIKAELNDKKQLYFYCIEEAAILLLDKYELINGNWSGMR